MDAKSLNDANRALESLFQRLLSLDSKDSIILDYDNYSIVKDFIEGKKEEIKEPEWKVSVETEQGLLDSNFYSWYTARDFVISAIRKDPSAKITLLSLPLCFPNNAKDGEWIVRFPLTDKSDWCGFDSYEKALAFFMSCVKGNRCAEILQC